MSRYLIYLIACVAILGLGYGVLAPLGLGWLIPGIPLLIVICIVMEYNSLDFWFFALVLGLWMDMLYGLPIGTFTGAYVLGGTISYALMQYFFWTDTGWKYYVLVVLGIDILMLGWIWLFPFLLVRVHWVGVGISGVQLWHNAWKIVLVHLIFAFPLYGLVNVVVSRWSRFRRSPLKFS